MPARKDTITHSSAPSKHPTTIAFPEIKHPLFNTEDVRAGPELKFLIHLYIKKPRFSGIGWFNLRFLTINIKKKMIYISIHWLLWHDRKDPKKLR
jgi:hypothetical protein